MYVGFLGDYKKSLLRILLGAACQQNISLTSFEPIETQNTVNLHINSQSDAEFFVTEVPITCVQPIRTNLFENR